MPKPVNPGVLCYTDGGYSRTYQIGGWAAVIYFDDHNYQELCGAQGNTSSLHMETVAVIRALDCLYPGSQVALYTDCMTLKRIAERIQVTGHLPHRTRETWKELGRLLRRHRVQWHYVKGHGVNRDNERVHQLCQWAMQEHRFELMREKRRIESR